MVTAITNTFIFIVFSLSLNFAFAADEAVQFKKEDRQEALDLAKEQQGQLPAEQPQAELQVNPAQTTTPAAPAQKQVKRVVRRKRIVEDVKETESKIGMTIGAAAWGEQILLQSGDGRTENIIVEYSGLALGLDYTLKGESVGWNTAVKALFLTGNAQAEGHSISYQNNVEAITPLFASTGLRFYPHEKVNITLNVGASFYQLKLDPPTSVVTSYDFKYANAVQAIAQLQLGWMVADNWLFQQEMFVSEKNEESVGWIVSLGYVF